MLNPAKALRTFYILLFAAMIPAIVTAESTKINWKQRFDYWTSRYQTRFQAPNTGKEITITQKNGKEISGVLIYLQTNSVTIKDTTNQENTCSRKSLSRDDRMKLFKDDFARANALQQVLREKEDYTCQNAPPSPQTIQAEAQQLTDAQFSEYAATLSGCLVQLNGTVSDVQMNFFSEYQCYVTLTANDAKPVVATFTIGSQDALSINKNQSLEITGIIKSVRLYQSEIRITLIDASTGLVTTPQESLGHEQQTIHPE